MARHDLVATLCRRCRNDGPSAVRAFAARPHRRAPAAAPSRARRICQTGKIRLGKRQKKQRAAAANAARDACRDLC